MNLLIWNKKFVLFFVKVNDENVENMTTNNVIDMLRIVRGPVCIVIARKIS